MRAGCGVVGDVVAQIDIHRVLAEVRGHAVERDGRIVGGGDVPSVKRGDGGERRGNWITGLQWHEPHGKRGIFGIG